jgi:hypothetical protein
LVGIESDQLVFDYLSRVGDLAHSTQMSAAERARLVGDLRGRIDRERAAEGGAVTKGAVQKILNRIGSAEDVVASANGGVSPRPAAPMPSSEAAADGSDAGPQVPRGTGAGSGSGKKTKETKGTEKGSGNRNETPTAAFGASSPHLASLDELGAEDTDPDWWRADRSPFGNGPVGASSGSGPLSGGPLSTGEPVPGFVGGIEVPEVLKPPPADDTPEAPRTAPGAPASAAAPAAPGASTAPQAPAAEAAPTGTPGLGALMLLRRRMRGGDKAEGVSRRGGIVEWAAVILLVAGVVVGSPIPLAAGWLASWWSPKLSRIEAKWATLVMPGLVATGGVVWLWGRAQRHWGEPLAEGGDALREALSGAFPVVLRVAAIASALYLIWRARRPAQS